MASFWFSEYLLPLGWLVGTATGTGLNLVVLGWAMKKKHLTTRAGIIAIAMGITFWMIEPIFFIALLVFFISSSVLSKLGKATKATVEQIVIAKGSQRDAIQVLANGAVAWVACALYLAFSFLPGGERGAMACFVAAITAIAASNGDTWATEIGIMVGGQPRWILDVRRTVTRGTSGGVSFKGTLGALAGAAFVATTSILAGLLLGNFTSENIVLGMLAFLLPTAAGFAGSIMDSILGATIQGFYTCTACGRGTEKRVHCNTSTTITRGKPWMNNDLVNFLATLAAATVSMLSTWLLAG